MANAILKGAALEQNVTTIAITAFDASINHLCQSDAIIFGTPENFGYMSGALKDFFDRTYYEALPLELNLPYALFVSAGNDGTGAVREVDRILKGYPMRKVAEPIISVKEVLASDLQRCEQLGATIAAGLDLGIF